MTAARLLPILAAGLVAHAPPLLAQRPRFDLAAARRVVGVSSPAVSPDGRTLAFLLNPPDYALNRPYTHLNLVDAASGAQRPLTFERPDVSDPRWAPDGRSLAFLASEPGADAPQLWVLSMEGGDARRLTRAPDGVQSYAWRPDGGAIAYVTQDSAAADTGEARYRNGFRVGNGDMFLEQPVRPSHVWLVPTAGGEPRRLTSGAWTVEFSLPPGLTPSGLSWSPDGGTLAFVRIPTTETGSGDSTSVALLDVGSGAIHGLTGSHVWELGPRYSPDGRWIAFRVPRSGYDSWNHVYEAILAPAEGGAAPRSLTRALDRNLFNAEWMPDGASLLVAANTETTVGLWLQPLDGPAKRLELGDLVVSGAFGYEVDVGRSGAIAFVATTGDHPAELYFMDSPSASPRRLTDLNAGTARLALGRTERVEWNGPDGFHEDGVVVYPPDFDPARRYPLVLLIHGGPQFSSTTGFSTPAQLLAAEGWIVFEPNYRGSDNLGDRYMAAIENDAGRGPGRDVMAGVAAMRRRPYVDPTRTAVTGWSYGGFMTAWLIAHYPDEWRAAVAGAPVTDWEDMYNLSDTNVAVRYSFGGSPWTGGRMKAYREQSPITYVSRVRVPTLIMSATRDFRVPPSEAYAFYRALRDRGVETRFIAYPARSHFPGDPVRRLDVMEHWVAWVRDHLGEAGSMRETRR
jgi:dipeptidyl aminopeptidase/acylaminoacyl peptidase